MREPEHGVERFAFDIDAGERRAAVGADVPHFRGTGGIFNKPFDYGRSIRKYAGRSVQHDAIRLARVGQHTASIEGIACDIPSAYFSPCGCHHAVCRHLKARAVPHAVGKRQPHAGHVLNIIRALYDAGGERARLDVRGVQVDVAALLIEPLKRAVVGQKVEHLLVRERRDVDDDGHGLHVERKRKSAGGEQCEADGDDLRGKSVDGAGI